MEMGEPENGRFSELSEWTRPHLGKENSPTTYLDKVTFLPVQSIPAIHVH